MPSSFLDGKIKFYRYSKGEWRRQSEGGSRHLQDSSVDQLPSNDESIKNASEGDWLVRRKNAKNVFISRVNAGDVMALYYFDQNRWHHLHWHATTHGHKAHRMHVKERLAGFVDVENHSLALDKGIDEGIIVFYPNGKKIEYETEEFLEFPDAGFSKAADYDEYLAEKQENQRLESIMSDAQNYLDALKGNEAKSAFAKFAGWKNDDSMAENLVVALGKIIEEATPTPATSGVTGVNDIVQLVNNFQEKWDKENECAQYFDVKHEQLKGSDAQFAKADVVFSYLATLGSLYTMGSEACAMYKLHNKAPGSKTADRQHKGARNTSHANYQMANVKFVTSLVTALDTTAKLTSSSAFGIAMQGASKFTGPMGTAVGLLVMARHTRKALSARTRQTALKAIMNSEDANVENQELKRCIELLLHKIRRRKFYQGATGAVAGISFGGGACMTVVAVTGVANAWNPVGWVLLGGAAAGGLGLTGYKVYRRWKIKSRHDARREVAGGANVVDAESAARALVKLYRFEKDKTSRESKLAAAALGVFGVVATELDKSDAVREEAIALVVRHACR